jgi:hypothetical protein
MNFSQHKNIVIVIKYLALIFIGIPILGLFARLAAWLFGLGWNI